MDTNKMRDISREQFEAKFPVPAGVAWKEAIGMYEVVDIWKLDQAITIGRYNWLWEGWQASREAVVVELPSEDTCRTSTSKDEAAQDAYNHALGECRSVIEAQGLKVSP